MITSKLNIVRNGLFAFRFSFIASLLLVATGLASCSEDDDTNSNNEYSNWESRNNEYFESVYQQAKTAIDAGDNSWFMIKSYSKDNSEGAHTDYVVVHVLDQDLEHDEVESFGSLPSPEYTDTVRVHYRGNLMPSASYSDGYQFDSSWLGSYDLSAMVPSKFAVNGLVNGFATAVMRMHVGDRWKVYVSWKLGYGSSSSSSSIPNYSTLVFDLTLHSFGKPGSAMPSFQ
jgi:FKBP-type peptidyl-prolyl cis-trans isomerase FklB